MRIYLIDRDSISRTEPAGMIETEELGEVSGMSTGWGDACGRIPSVCPDAILADLSLPELKVITYIRRIKEKLPGSSITMLSPTHDMETVQRTYEGGTQLFLHRPANMMEIRNVLRSMEMIQNMQWTLKQVRSGTMDTPNREASQNRDEEMGNSISLSLSIGHLKEVLQEIGIINETGSKDTIRIISYLIEQGLDLSDITVWKLCRGTKQNPKSVGQRIRRAAPDGTYHLAARGLDDYTDPAFNGYGDRLYSFEQMKKKMNFIRGRSEKHGNVRIKNFLGDLLDCCREV